MLCWSLRIQITMFFLAIHHFNVGWVWYLAGGLYHSGGRNGGNQYWMGLPPLVCRCYYLPGLVIWVICANLLQKSSTDSMTKNEIVFLILPISDTPHMYGWISSIISSCQRNSTKKSQTNGRCEAERNSSSSTYRPVTMVTGAEVETSEKAQRVLDLLKNHQRNVQFFALE